MRRTIYAVLGVLALVFVAAQDCPAVVIFDNGGPLTGLGDDRVSDVDFPLQVADDFALPGGSNTITDVHWWGVYYPGATPGIDDFTIEIYQDAGGLPAAAALHSVNVGSVMRTDTGLDQADGDDIYEFWALIPPTTVPAGTTHWLSIYNDTTADADDNWYWSYSNPFGNSFASPFTGVWEQVLGKEHAFQLTSDVIPEPTTLILLPLGALAALRRRRR